MTRRPDKSKVSLQINAVAGDDVINAVEASSRIVISGSSAGLTRGTTFVVTVSDGGVTSKYVATVNQAGSGWTAVIPSADAIKLQDGTAVISATVKDGSGSDVTATHTVQVHELRPSLTVNAVACDNVVDATEADAQGGVTLIGSASGFAAGARINVSVQDGGLSITAQGVVNAAGTGWSALLSHADALKLADGAATVTAAAADPWGNRATASLGFQVHEAKPTLSIDPVLGTDVVNATASGQAGGISLTGAVGGLPPGALIQVAVAAGGVSLNYQATVSASGATWSTVIPSADAIRLVDGTATITATAADIWGNASTASHEIQVHVTKPAVGIDPIIADHVVQSSGILLSGTVSGLAAGQTFEVSLADGSFVAAYKATVNAAGTGWAAVIPTADALRLASGTASVSVQPTDAWGNHSPLVTETFQVARSALESTHTASGADSVVPSLGTNLEWLSYWSASLPTIDLTKASSDWIPQRDGIWNTGELLDLDENGWVRDLPQGDTAALLLLHDNPAAAADARYLVTYSGEGTLTGMIGTRVVSSEDGRLVVQSASDGSLTLSLKSTDPNQNGDYLRDIHVVREEFAPFAQNGLSFNPDFIAKVDDFHTFRFMDLMQTNTIYDKTGHAYDWMQAATAEQIDWADRPTISDAHWDHGMPVEALVELANRTGTDAWFNMPTNASDDYVRGFADYVKDNLRPDLKIHVEFSNEVWNWGFPQAYYAQAHASTDLGSDANWLEWYGMRSAQIGAIWHQTFDEPATGGGDTGRVAVVFGTQFGWRGLEIYGLDTQHWLDASGNHIRAADYFNEYAITGYYDGGLSDSANAARVEGWINDPQGVAKALAALQQNLESTVGPGYQYHSAEAQLYGLKLVTYESGFSAQNPQSEMNNQFYTDFLTSLQQQPEIYHLDTENFTLFKNAGGSQFMNFEAISGSSRFGSWGALESVNQDSSARYSALMDWNSSVVPWFEPARDPTTFANARFYVAGDGGETIAGTLHGYDVLVGGTGTDIFVPHGFSTSLDGAGGDDTVVLGGSASSHAFTQQADTSWLISHFTNGFVDGVDQIRNIEHVQFEDLTLNLGPNSMWHI